MIPDDRRDDLSFAGACGLFLKGHVPLWRLPGVLPILVQWGLHPPHRAAGGVACRREPRSLSPPPWRNL